MTGLSKTVLSVAVCAACLVIGAQAQLSSARPASTEQAFSERTFPQSKATIEKALPAMQANLSGRLPVLEGFAESSERGLGGYTRGYYQATVEIHSTASGGSLVRVAVKVTAWYSDPAAAADSGYRSLPSNGRIEQDVLDQLAEQLASIETADDAAKSAPPNSTRPDSAQLASQPNSAKPASAQSAKFESAEKDSVPVSERSTNSPPAPIHPRSVFSSPPASVLAKPETLTAKGAENAAATRQADSSLQAEAASLQEILDSQGHPRNLVAVKKSGTPVVGAASLNAKPLFLASQHDEFEILDFNADWVHVRISGLSRGWIWRNSVEMPDGIPDTDVHPAASLAPAADLFHVSRQEDAQFPGDWAPLRQKTVMIFSVQAEEGGKDAGPRQRLEYAKFLLQKNYEQLSQKRQELAGMVVIFDSADGGMIAATAATLQEWKAGKLSDAALWHNCYFDPPETFESRGSSGSE